MEDDSSSEAARHRLDVGGGLLGRRGNHRRKLLTALRGAGQRARGRLEFGRGRGDGSDDFADHGFELARNGVDAPAALDLGLGIGRGDLVGGLLGDQCFLEDLERVRHRADLGLLAAMRHVGREVALAERLHRADDRGNAARNVAHEIIGGADRHQDRGHDHADQHAEDGGVAVGRLLRLELGAPIVELDALLEQGIGGLRHLGDLGLQQLVGVDREAADALARQRHHVLHAVQIFGPCLGPLLIERALLGGRDERLIDLARLVDPLAQRGEALLGGVLALGGVLHQMQAERDTQLVDVGAKRAERAHARQPALRNLDGVRIDVLHGSDRRHADTGERQNKNRQHGQKLEDDRQLRHHNKSQ